MRENVEKGGLNEVKQNLCQPRQARAPSIRFSRWDYSVYGASDERIGCEMMLRGERAGDAISKVIRYSDWAESSLGQGGYVHRCFCVAVFCPPAVWAEWTAPNKTIHRVPAVRLTGKSLIRSDGFSLQTRPMKPHTLEELHLQQWPTGRKRCITQSMQLHLIEAVHNADTEHYRPTFICHNPAAWISCQHNMYVVLV